MIWLTWRQFRLPAIVALGGLGVVAIILAVTGPHIAGLFDTSVATCTVNCSSARSLFARYDLPLQNGLNALVIFVPALIGLFWGAPLVAREFETGTFRLAWTEGVTRRSWMATKLAVVGLASMLLAGLLSLFVTWWSSSFDRMNLNRLSPGVFAARDVVPIGYGALAFALGVTAGLLIRRTIPAMLVALGAFFGARLGMTYWVRPHLASPLALARSYWTPSLARSYGSALSKGQPLPFSYPMKLAPPRGAWEVSNNTVNASGQIVSTISCAGGGVRVHGPKPARPTAATIRAANEAGDRALHACLTQFQQLLGYQPASRYWMFQWDELAIFAGVAVALSGFCIWWISRRLA
ncbi:MAG: ABC transporter permease [Acidimicrobiales bacterium]